MFTCFQFVYILSYTSGIQHFTKNLQNAEYFSCFVESTLFAHYFGPMVSLSLFCGLKGKGIGKGMRNTKADNRWGTKIDQNY